MPKLVIVGGSASGMACAARCRRLDERSEIIVFEKSLHASFAHCGMPYFLGKSVLSRSKLDVTPEVLLRKGYKFDLRLGTEVLRVDRQKKIVVAKDLSSGKEVEESYDSLVLCMGSNPWIPPIENARTTKHIFTLGHSTDMDAIYARAETSATCVILGGGFVGLEVAEQMKKRGIKVTVVELLPHVIPPLDLELANMVSKELRTNGIDVFVNSSIKTFAYDEGQDKVVCTVETKKRRFVETKKLAVDFVLVSTGVRSCTGMAKEMGLDLTSRNLVIVNEHLQTSDPSVYACGELVESTNLMTGSKGFVPLANVANIQGRIAANHMLGSQPDSYKGSSATAIMKLFSLEIAILGTSEELCKRFKIDYRTATALDNSFPMYMPRKGTPAFNVSMKATFTPEGGIIGFQSVGIGGVYAIATTMSTAVAGKLTVYDLETLELPYCPFFGQARNPVNTLGMVAAGILRGTHKMLPLTEYLANPKKYKVVDVRPPHMFKAGHLDGAINIPLPALRDRLGDLSPDDDIVMCCNVGKMAYWSCRVLEENGFKKVQALSGGWFLYARGN